MSFDCLGFLAELYGDRPAAAEPAPGGSPDGRTEPDGDPQPEGWLDFSGWLAKPDALGRLGREAPGIPDGERWWTRGGFDDLPEPGDGCPVCGSLETWLDLAGGRHCGRCERDKLARALELTDRAARLRAAGSRPTGTAEPTPGEPHGCEGTDRPDPQHLQAERPAAAIVGPSAGREAGQGQVASGGG